MSQAGDDSMSQRWSSGTSHGRRQKSFLRRYSQSPSTTRGSDTRVESAVVLCANGAGAIPGETIASQGRKVRAADTGSVERSNLRIIRRHFDHER
jgi:hypothetical protein